MSDTTTMVFNRPVIHQRGPAPCPYLHGLDGVRALAVLLVVVYHADPSWLPGGFLGVDVFFVLSGYLITNLLCAERHRTGRIDLLQFWLRRARRLLPALVTLLVTVTAVAALWRPARIDASGRDILSALTFTNNWWQISTHASYFASFGPPPLFQHLWTLGVEEQFYLAWPLVVLGLLWAVPHAHARVRVAVVLAAAGTSLALMVLLHQTGEDTSRAYFGSDTHAFGLLLGAALALMVPPARTWKHRWAPRVCGAAGVVGWMVLWVLAGVIHSDSAHLYPWGFAAAAGAAGAVVLAAAQADSVFVTVMSASWLRWIGRRSYGIYLWHMPLIALAVPKGHTARDVPLNGLCAAALAVAVAAASYRWVEEPLRRHGLRRTATMVLAALAGEDRRAATDPLRADGGFGAGDSRHGAPGDDRAAKRPSWVPRVLAVGAGLAVLVAAWGISTAGDGNSAADRIAAAQRALHGGAANRSTHPTGAESVTAVGDSVMVAAAPALQEDFPGIAIDAKVSRQLSVGPAVVRSLGKQRRLNQVLLIGLGTNGVGGRQDLEQIVREAGHRTVVLVTVHGPLGWKDQVNTAIRQTAAAHPNVVLADWDRAIQGKDDLLADDGIHPGPAGGRLYAKTVAQALDHAKERT
ncbi:acyltransferase family protein [Streptomyces sp. 4F14]|uniref:acyltransferase family protein n=1 Tax=Streptomyces sp. 4F14 TaxID=3394380 RepID=UPI003A85D70C